MSWITKSYIVSGLADALGSGFALLSRKVHAEGVCTAIGLLRLGGRALVIGQTLLRLVIKSESVGAVASEAPGRISLRIHEAYMKLKKKYTYW